MTTAERISQGSAPGSGLEVIGCLWFWTGFSWRGAGPVAQPPSGSGHSRDGFRRHYRGHGRSHKATALSDGALAGPARSAEHLPTGKEGRSEERRVGKEGRRRRRPEECESK